MATRVGTAFIDVKGDFSPFDRQVRAETGRTKKRFAPIGRAATLGLTAGFAGAGLIIKKSFNEMRDAEKVGNQTRAVLKSTGGAAKVAAGEVEGLAEALSVKVGIDDEAIQSAENLLLTFTKVRNETGKGNKVFNEATRAVVDMSAALKQDLGSSAIQVGKALNDPIKGMTALRRVGVSFTQDQQDRVAGWVEEGKLLKAQKFILRELSTEFGGSAKAQADGFDRIQVSVDNLFESLGETAGPAVEDFANDAAKFIDQMRTGKGAGGEFADTMEDIGEAVLPVAKFTGRAAVQIGKFAAKHPQITTIATASGVIAAAFAKFKIGKGLAALIGLATGRGGGALGGTLSRATPVPVLVTNPGFAGAPGRPGGGTVVGAPGSRAVVPSAPKTPFEKLPAGVKGAIGSTAIGLGAVKITTDFFKDKSDLGLLDQFADDLERVAKAGDGPGMRKLAKDLREVAEANQDQTEGKALREFADELDRTADKGGKDISGLARLFDRLPKTTGSSLGQVGRDLDKAGAKTKIFGSRQAYLADQSDKAEARVKRLRDAIRALGGNLSGTGSNVDALRARLERLKSRYDVEILLQLQARGPANLTDEGFPRPRREGGLVMRGGGLVPAMLSPGEEGILPGGGRFRVPGARVRADTVPMGLPRGTAILTADGQRKERSGMPLWDVLRKQMPHFREGGFVKSNINLAALAAQKAGFKGRALVNMLAIAGRESRWNPKATNFKYPDHSIGLWQINQLAHKGRFGTDQQLMDRLRNAKAAKSLFDSSGYSPWVSVQHGNATQYLDEARKAVAATKRGGGSFTSVTPAPITHPLLATQLRPLVDDALLGGIQAGMEGTSRVDLLQEILEGIVPESSDRATRERLAVGGGGRGGGAKGPVASRIRSGIAWLKGVDRRDMAYQYGGGHGQIGVGNPSFDCSGYVSGGLWKMGLLDSPQTSVTLGSWGLAGEGRNVTVGTRGGGGMSGHTMMAAKDPDTDRWRFFESGGGHGPSETSGWNGSFTTWRHPAWRKGGIVGMRKGGMLPPSPEGQRHLEKLARQRKVPVAELLDPKSRNFVGFGLRKGGMVGPNFDFEEWLRKFKRRHHRPPSLNELTDLLGSDQLGTRNADRATRVLGQRVQGRSIGALLATQRRARQKIRRMAKHGFTGPERIRTRRLRGAISLLQDEMGRPIGRAIGRSDRLQEQLDRQTANLPSALTVMGVDPESRAGLTAQRDIASQQLFRLGAQRGGLQKALARAKRTPGKADDRIARDALQALDDRMLALRASIIDLDNSVKQEETDRLADAQEEANRLAAERNALHAASNAVEQQKLNWAQTQGPALSSALGGIANGWIGVRAGLARQFPSKPGAAGVARL